MSASSDKEEQELIFALESSVLTTSSKSSVISSSSSHHPSFFTPESYSASFDIESWPKKLGARPMSQRRPAILTRDIIMQRCRAIVDHVVYLDAFFYHLSDDPDFKKNTKWKMYIYLRKCILDYKAKLPHEELTLVLDFLKASQKDRTWFQGRLMDLSEKDIGEYWGSGMHEWLERCLTLQVLERSANMISGVEDTVDLGCIWGDVDWLYVQAVCRSRTKYIYYRQIDNSIVSGHTGAVKSSLGGKGFENVGSRIFDQALINAFNESTKLVDFIKRVVIVFEEKLTDPNIRIHASAVEHYLVDGTKTTESERLEFFRLEKLLPYNQEIVHAMFHRLYLVISAHGDRDDDVVLLPRTLSSGGAP